MSARGCGSECRAARGGAAGAALLEALIAVAVVITITTSIALLIARSRQAVWAAGTQSSAVAAAQQKLEQLAALEWRVDGAGIRHSDDSTDLSLDPPAAGGAGLQSTPADSLDRNIPGAVDFLGADGTWRGGGSEPPPDTTFVRRWSIARYAADPDDTLVLTVLVVPLAGTARHGAARLQTMRTRIAR
jgi:hypothetical protein